VTFYSLTIDTTPALHSGRHAAMVASGALLRPAGLMGAWSVKFGPLNGVYLMQSADTPDTLAGLERPALPQDFAVQDRQVILLQGMTPLNAIPAEATICELRTYDPYHDVADRFLHLMMEHLPIRTSYSPNIGVWRALAGRSGRVYHMWAYRSAEERDAVRARLQHDTAWQSYVGQILPMLQTMSSTLLAPISLTGA